MISVFESEIGRLKIKETNGKITEIVETNLPLNNNQSKLITTVKRELNEYFNGKRTEFTFPIEFSGTSFENSVWQELLKIPYGEVRTYLDIATIVKSKKYSRAVANAIGRNKLLIIVPCHRVIRTDGTIGGFRLGADVKQQLLSLENTICKN